MLPPSYLHDMKIKQVVNKFLKAYAEKKDVYPGDAPDDRIRDVEYAHMVRTIYAKCKIDRHAEMAVGYKGEEESEHDYSFAETIGEFATARKLPFVDDDLKEVVAKLDSFHKQLMQIAYKTGYERNPDNLIWDTQERESKMFMDALFFQDRRRARTQTHNRKPSQDLSQFNLPAMDTRDNSLLYAVR